MVGEQTQTKLYDFYETKNGMVDNTGKQSHKLKHERLAVRYLLCDNAGGNNNLQTRDQISDWKLGTDFECAGR